MSRPDRIVLLLLIASLTGCFGRVRRFESNRDILVDLSAGLGLDLSSAGFEIFHGEIREDAVLLYYRGIEKRGDQAWIWRFSEKSTEQRPADLREVSSLEPVLARYRREFTADPVQSVVYGSAQVSYMTYVFESPVHAQDGEPLEGRGVFGIVESTSKGEPVIFYVNLDNWGDRIEVSVESLEPFLKAIVGEADVEASAPSGARKSGGVGG